MFYLPLFLMSKDIIEISLLIKSIIVFNGNRQLSVLTTHTPATRPMIEVDYKRNISAFGIFLQNESFPVMTIPEKDLLTFRPHAMIFLTS